MSTVPLCTLAPSPQADHDAAHDDMMGLLHTPKVLIDASEWMAQLKEPVAPAGRGGGG